jgi:hypothetical protein
MGLPSLLYPFGRDQGEYAAIADEIGRGKVAYRDVFDVKPPLTHRFHGLALHTFGHSMFAIRGFDLIWQALTAALLATLGTLTFGRASYGMVAAFLYAVWYYSFDYWSTAQSDGFLTLFVVIALLACRRLETARSIGAAIACGAALAVAALFKYPIGVLLPFLMAVELARSGINGLRAVAAMAGGSLVPIALAGALLAWQGSLPDFVFIQTTYVPVYNLATAGYAHLAQGLVVYIRGLPWMVIPMGSILVVWVLNRRRQLRQAAWLLLWWLSAMVHMLVQNKFYPYHGLPLLAPGALLTAYLAVTTADASRSRRHWRALGAIEATVVGGLCLLFWAAVARPAVVSWIRAGTWQLEDVYSHFGTYGEGDYSVRADIEVATYLKAHTTAEDTLFIWGFEPTVYFLAERSSASRFLYNFPLYGDYGLPEFRAQLVQELRANKPAYIAVVANDAMPWVTGTNDDSLTALAKFHELEDLISEDYSLETQIEHFDLYRLGESRDQASLPAIYPSALNSVIM